MATQIRRTDDYGANMARCGAAMPCVVCGRAVRSARAPMIHVNYLWRAITDDEYRLAPEDSQGCWPIGPDCLRRHPELRPYCGPVAG